MRAFRDYSTVSVFVLASAFAITGCSSSRYAQPTLPGAGSATLPPITADAAPEFDGVPPPSAFEGNAEKAILARLAVASQSWDGTPYLFGGATRDGADCSGFVREVFGEFFGLRLTRATATQVREGKEVRPEHLRPGDLVFFRTGPSQRHVGIYLYDGRFLHASTRRGVTIDRLDSGFYERTFWTARRVIPGQLIQQLAASVEEAAPEDTLAEQAPAAPPAESLDVTVDSPPENSGRLGW